MKKAVLTIVLSLVAVVTFAQNNETPKTLKYVTTGPDGNVAMTITDDATKDNMQLESAKNFYKYQILDPKTSEPIYSANNKGNSAAIDKSKLAAGTYDLRLYTSSFVITSKITVSGTRKLQKAMSEGTAVAMNSND